MADDDVDVAIVIEIAEGSPATHLTCGQAHCLALLNEAGRARGSRDASFSATES